MYGKTKIAKSIHSLFCVRIKKDSGLGGWAAFDIMVLQDHLSQGIQNDPMGSFIRLFFAFF